MSALFARGQIFSGLLLSCWLCHAVEVRWAQSSNRIYVDGPGKVSISEIRNLAPPDALQLVDTNQHVWLLQANLIVRSNAQLQIYGPDAGGDVSELRLKSENTGETNAFVELRADSGWIEIRNTKITSWDSAANGPDQETDQFGRAFVRARSTLDPDTGTVNESRMDVHDSEICYLGFGGTEAYGLTWKVVGEYTGPADSIFDRVKVYGDAVNNRIHHNYFGIYTFGHSGGRFAFNEVNHNFGYGIDPHDDSDYQIIENNDVHDNGWDGIIASQRCNNLVIRNNVSRNNGQNGIILHRSCNDALVEGNLSISNGTSGLVLAGSANCLVRGNKLIANAEAGIRLALGSERNWLETNESASNRLYGLYFYQGSDLPEPGNDGRPRRNQIQNNHIHGNASDAVNLADSDDNVFASNRFISNGGHFVFRRGFRNLLVGNEIPGRPIVKTLGSQSDAPSTYVEKQALLHIQVDPFSNTVFQDQDGQIFDTAEKDIETQVSPTGASLVLNAHKIGASSIVVARELWCSAGSGTVLVDPTSWPDSGETAKQWTMRPLVPATVCAIRLGGLSAGQPYVVSKLGIPLITAFANGEGTIQFSDLLSSTNKTAYSVEPSATPAPGIFVELQGDTVVVTWTHGVLQSTSDPLLTEWQTSTNESFRVVLPVNAPAMFFRSFSD